MTEIQHQKRGRPCKYQSKEEAEEAAKEQRRLSALKYYYNNREKILDQKTGGRQNRVEKKIQNYISKIKVQTKYKNMFIEKQQAEYDKFIEDMVRNSKIFSPPENY